MICIACDKPIIVDDDCYRTPLEMSIRTYHDECSQAILALCEALHIIANVRGR